MRCPYCRYKHGGDEIETIVDQKRGAFVKTILCDACEKIYHILQDINGVEYTDVELRKMDELEMR